MSKQCSVCGKEIIVGTTCMDCMKRAQEEAEEQARFDKAVSSVDYKKLTIRICLVVAILVASVGYAWITDDSDENEVAQNASQSNINVNEQSEETYYDTDEVYTNELFGSWINLNNNSTWTFKENEYIMDFSQAFPGDYSNEAVEVRQMDPIYVPCRIEGNYIIFNMSGVSYCNRFNINGDTLTIINSVSGDSTIYKRK